MKSRIISWISLAIIICLSCFSVKSCSECHEGNRIKKSITYNVTGYHHEPAGYKRSAHRYIFLHNDKYGDFTFEVSPKTFYDATQGQKTMTFTDTFNELMYRADNENTKQKLIEHKEDFGVTQLPCDSNIMMIIMVFYTMFPLLWGLALLLFDEEALSNFNIIHHLTWIIWLIGLILSLIVSFI